MTDTRIKTLISTHEIRLRSLPTTINIELWKDEETEHISASASHYIKTPQQLSPYFPEPSPSARTPEAAIRSIVSGYETYFDQAVEAGDVPVKTGLVAV